MRNSTITNRIIAFEKVEKVIESCETYQHLFGADNMIESFTNMYGSDNDYTRALNSLYLEKNQELGYNPDAWQPCGKARQQAGNAEYQLEMLNRFNDYIGGR